MDVIVMKDRKSVGTYAARMVAAEIRKKPDLVISFPTGSSPIPCYEELTRMHREDGLDFSQVYGFNMDEYIPLPGSHPQSCFFFMQQYLYRHVNMDSSRLYAPDATREDLDAVCNAYTQTIREFGGFDLIILGIGRDGHITFNMPSECSHVFTYQENLSPKTIQDNSRFFKPDETVPTRALTLGMNLILSSKKVILVADGEAKSKAVGRFVSWAEITPRLPASFLWIHNDVTVVADEAAAREIAPDVKIRRVAL